MSRRALWTAGWLVASLLFGLLAWGALSSDTSGFDFYAGYVIPLVVLSALCLGIAVATARGIFGAPLLKEGRRGRPRSGRSLRTRLLRFTVVVQPPESG
jgi:hypothetical protein